MTLDRTTMDDPLEGFTSKDAADLRAFGKNADWVIDHDDLIEPYVGRFIVVIEEQIVALGADYVELRRAFITRQDAYIRFVEPRGQARMWHLGVPATSL
jgi:hypothetical protein